MPQTTDQFISANQARFLEELYEYLRIPSISTLPENEGDVRAAAQFTADKLKAAGLENVEIIPTGRHPLVYADWLHAPGKPTVLCYGHYDVQPPDPIELWNTPPFEPTLRDGNIYARGSADDKGQVYMHIKAVEALMHSHEGKLPLNLKFIIEGEEEIGGASIAKFVPLNKEKLKADVALVSDTALYAEGIPTLCIGLRGLVYMEIECKGPGRDLHSGLYGGAAPNAVAALVAMLGKAKDDKGRIIISGFLDEVDEPAAAEIASWKSLPFDEKEFLEKEVGSKSLTGDPDRMILERVWSRPTLEIHGIAGGFTGAGAKTVIPATATAKVSMRLVPNQDPVKMFERFSAWVAANTPEGTAMEVRKLSGAPATVVNRSSCDRMAAEAFKEAMGPSGVYPLGRVDPDRRRVCASFGDPVRDDGGGFARRRASFAEREYKLDNFYLGLRTVAKFFERYRR